MFISFREFLTKLSTSESTELDNFSGRTPSRRAGALATCFILVGAFAGIAVGSLSHARIALPPRIAVGQNSQDSTNPDLGPSPPLAVTPKQRRAILKSNFEKIKKDTDELATLAKSLQEEIGRSNENVLSLKVVDEADKIEKLARKIKSTAKGE